MAAFNPDTQSVGSPNWSGVSRGTGPNETFDALFSGLTKTAQNVTQIKDQATQMDIREEADQQFEQVNNEFGLSAPDVPAGMQSELDRMTALQAAVEQGKISQVNYYGRLATLSKQLRSKYPGYEAVVDSTIQSVTGTRPANAYRDALFNEVAQFQQSATDEVKFRRQYEKENEGVIAAIYGDDYFQNPGNYDFNKIRSDVSKFKGKAELIDSETKELGLLAKRGEYNDVRAAKAIDQDFGFITQSVMSKAMNLNSPSAMNQIDQFVAKGGGTPEELNSFIGNITKLEGDLRSQLTNRGREQYVTTGILSQEKVNEAVEAALYPVTKAKEAILGGDFKLASKYATLNKAATDYQLNQMLEADPVFRAGMGLNEINQNLGEQFFGSRQDQLETLALEVAGQSMAGRADIVKQTVESGNGKLSRQVVDKSFKAIIDPKLQGEKFSNMIDQFFGPSAIDFMSPKVVDPSDLEAVYTSFLRPEVTQAIVQKGTPEDLAKYTKWAFEKAMAIPAFRGAAGDINGLKTIDPSVQVTFDPNNMKLDIKSSQAVVANKLGYQPYARALNSFNRVMSVLKPVLDAQGENGPALAKELVKGFNVDLEGGSQKGFWRSVWEAMPDELTQELPALRTTPKEGQGSLLPDLSGLKSIIGAATDAFQPIGDENELDFMSTQSIGPDGGTDLEDLDDSDFVDPRSNPAVDSSVLSRFEGKRLPASIRLNNMGAVSIVGNIDKSWAAKQAGFVGAVSRPKREGGYYAQYATPEHGVAAASKLLERFGRKGVNTPTEITKKWAAEPGNYPNVLVRFLKQAGYNVGKNTPLDLSDPNVRLAILKAKSAHESGVGKPIYSEDVFLRGVNL